MDKGFMELTPKRFLCPYCGEWHEWNKAHELGYYDDEDHMAIFECSNFPDGCNKGGYGIYFYDGYLHYSTDSVCGRCYLNMDEMISISSIKEDSDKPIVTFEAEFTSRDDVGKRACSDCSCCEECNCVKLGDKGDNHHMTITFGFEFEQSDYDKIVRNGQPGCEDNGQMNQLLLLMLFKDKLGGDDDMMNTMLMASMTGGQNTGMNQLLPLMLFKDKLCEDDDMMKMMFMTSMMSVQAESGGQNTVEDDDDMLPF